MKLSLYIADYYLAPMTGMPVAKTATVLAPSMKTAITLIESAESKLSAQAVIITKMEQIATAPRLIYPENLP